MTRRRWLAGCALFLVLVLGAGSLSVVRATAPRTRPAELPPPVVVPAGASRALPDTFEQERQLRQAVFRGLYRPSNYAPADQCRMGQKTNFLRIRFGYDASGAVDPQCFDPDDEHCVCIADELRAAGHTNRELAGQYTDIETEMMPWTLRDELALHVRRVFGIRANNFGDP